MNSSIATSQTQSAAHHIGFISNTCAPTARLRAAPLRAAPRLLLPLLRAAPRLLLPLLRAAPRLLLPPRMTTAAAALPTGRSMSVNFR